MEAMTKPRKPELIEKYCYDNNNANCDTYGGLYQWNEMMQYVTTEGVQGICPTGWHLPSDNEWCTASQFIDPTVNCINGWNGTDIGIKMKSTSGWYENGNGSNNSGFNALPAGYRHINYNFYYLTTGTLFWTSTEVGSISWQLMDYSNGIFVQNNDSYNYGYSVRCIKDTPVTWSCGDVLNDTRDNQTIIPFKLATNAGWLKTLISAR